MLIDNSKKIVIKLGSSTVIDKKGNFKEVWVNSLIKDIKKCNFDKIMTSWQVEVTHAIHTHEVMT